VIRGSLEYFVGREAGLERMCFKYAGSNALVTRNGRLPKVKKARVLNHIPDHFLRPHLHVLNRFRIPANHHSNSFRQCEDEVAKNKLKNLLISISMNTPKKTLL
jgi:hypothetical protein